MTNEEAIKILKDTAFLAYQNASLDEINEAVGMAVEALQRETSDDAISREAVSKWLEQYGQDVLHGKYKFSLMYIWKNIMELPSVQPVAKDINVSCKDAISRQDAIDAVDKLSDKPIGYLESAIDVLVDLPSVQPEPLTDKEQRIFLAAMGREEKVCEEVDRNYTREPYEDSLMWICREIKRKVKGALWT